VGVDRRSDNVARINFKDVSKTEAMKKKTCFPK